MSENGPYPPELEALCDALINSDCDSAVKSRLFNILNNWEESKGFKLCDSNKHSSNIGKLIRVWGIEISSKKCQILTVWFG